MTVTTQQNKLVYTGNGSSTTYPVNTLSGDVLTGIILYNASELMVYVDGVLKTLNTDYTITSSTPPSNLIGRLVNASVVFTTAPANTKSVVLLRQLPLTQTLNLLDGNNPPPEQLETALDKTVSQIQQVQDATTRCFQLDPKTPSTAPTPYLIPSVDTFIGWDNAGNLVNRTADDISVLVSSSTTANVNANRAAILEVTAAGGFGSAIVGNLYEAIQALIFNGATALIPAGAMFAFAGTSLPVGARLLYCDGAIVSRTTYSRLFTAIGTTYGVGDGSTTFQLPDRRGRVGVGMDGGAGRLTSASTGGANASTFGGVGGSETHTLTVAQMPSHSHQIGMDTTNGASLNAIRAGVSAFLGNAQIANTGGGDPHSNTQPWIAFNYVIIY
jgi:microcystin-dependent protein